MDLAGLRGDSASVPQVDDVSRARYEQQHREKRDKDHLPAMEPPPEPTKRMKRIKRVWQDWKPHEGTAAKDAARTWPNDGGISSVVAQRFDSAKYSPREVIEHGHGQAQAPATR